MTSKAKAERLHRQRRAVERCGKKFSNETFDRFADDIRCGRATFLRRTSNTRTVWAVQHDGQQIAVVYNRTTKQIITVLPNEVLNGCNSGNRQIGAIRKPTAISKTNPKRI